MCKPETYSGLNELSPGCVFGTNIPQVRMVWVNQPRVQGLVDNKLTLLCGIHPRGIATIRTGDGNN